MSDVKFFLDTNILAYTFDTKDTRKQSIAKDLLQQALTGRGVNGLT